MILVSFGVKEYRSIAKTPKLPLTTAATILIGPNNEGKSNLVGALAVAMAATKSMGRAGPHGVHPRMLEGSARGVRYLWFTDFPVGIQRSHPKGESQFDLEFLLTPQEVMDFKAEVGSTLNGTLPIQLFIGRDSFRFKVTKKGPGAAALSKKARLIGQFLGRRVDFRHIKAIRTAEEARKVVDSLVSRELSVLEEDPKYTAAVQQIESLQAPILDALSKSVRDTLKEFLPSVANVSISVPPRERYRALTAYSEIIVDDGVPTELSEKGDGVKSLAALSLMRFASRTGARSRQLILAIEEPESHLHPKAIQQLRTTLGDIAQQHQTLLTTHCPLFVDRGNVAANIIVTGSKARPATSIAEIREVLGVRVADNLQHAELILFVEGETDRTSLTAILGSLSPRLQSALDEHYLVIDQLLGATKLATRLMAARDAMCDAYCFLDNDPAGRAAVTQAIKDGILTANDYSLASRPGMKDSEFEDLVDLDHYRAFVSEKYGIDIDVANFRKMKPRWSERLEALFRAEGKLWNEDVLYDIKGAICDQVAAAPATAVVPHARASIDALIDALHRRIR